jgi:Fe-S cluster assembly iron-binding protein IscA
MLFVASCALVVLGVFLFYLGTHLFDVGGLALAVPGLITALLGCIGLVLSALAYTYNISMRTENEPNLDADCSKKSVVVLTSSAAALAKSIIEQRGYSKDTAVRVVLESDESVGFGIRYDCVSIDDRDWIDNISGLTIIVAKAIAPRLEGLTVDASGDEYVFRREKLDKVIDGLGEPRGIQGTS